MVEPRIRLDRGQIQIKKENMGYAINVNSVMPIMYNVERYDIRRKHLQGFLQGMLDIELARTGNFR